MTVLSAKNDVLQAHLSASHLLPQLIRLELRQNMRLRDASAEPDTVQFLQELEQIGEGTAATNDCGYTSFPACVQAQPSIEALCEEVYGDLFRNEISDLSTYLSERTIVTPFLRDCKRLNDAILDKSPGELYSYTSNDSWVAGQLDENGEFGNAPLGEDVLNNLDIAGLPPHDLRFRPSTPLILLRNIRKQSPINPYEVLCHTCPASACPRF